MILKGTRKIKAKKTLTRKSSGEDQPDQILKQTTKALQLNQCSTGTQQKTNPRNGMKSSQTDSATYKNQAYDKDGISNH